MVQWDLANEAKHGAVKQAFHGDQTGLYRPSLRFGNTYFHLNTGTLLEYSKVISSV